MSRTSRVALPAPELKLVQSLQSDRPKASVRSRIASDWPLIFFVASSALFAAALALRIFYPAAIVLSH